MFSGIKQDRRGERRESQIQCKNKHHLKVITFNPQCSHFYKRGKINLLQLSATMCFGELNELNCSALWEQTYCKCLFIANSIGIEVDNQKQP